VRPAECHGHLGGAAGVALVVAHATSHGAGATGLLAGWNTAVVVCGALCIVAALVAAACRSATTDP
jgi:hypothetical protein